MPRHSSPPRSEPSGSVPVALLAAGRSTRLRLGGFESPKPCVEFLGGSIALSSLSAFTAAGLDRFLIVLGCDAASVRDHYENVAAELGCEVTFVETPQWDLGNGATALAAARSLGERPFLLAMADHLFSPTFIRDALEAPPRGREVCLAVDPQLDPAIDRNDLTKVRIESGRVVEIGKELTTWDAGDTGLFYCTGILAEGLERARAGGLHSLSAGVQECACRGAVRAIAIGHGNDWIDIDTPADLARAARIATSWPVGSSRQPARSLPSSI